MQIAIDGPASAGKSTVAKRVAAALNYVYCDTGAMYRAVTLYAKQQHLDYGDEAQLKEVLPKMEISFKPDQTEQQVFLDGQNVTLAIREPEVTNNVSQVSALPAVREALVAQQRKIAASGNIVMDGRDIGTAVLPSAPVKIFLLASAAQRAKRRYRENVEKGIDTPLAQLQQEIEQRDYKDSHREISPLKQAEDAVVIDSTSMTINEVVAAILDVVKINSNK